MKKEIEKILYQNSTDCSDGLIIDFNKIDSLIDEICNVKSVIDNFSKQYENFEEWRYVENYYISKKIIKDKDGIMSLEYIRHFKPSNHSPKYLTTHELYKEFLNSKDLKKI